MAGTCMTVRRWRGLTHRCALGEWPQLRCSHNSREIIRQMHASCTHASRPANRVQGGGGAQDERGGRSVCRRWALHRAGWQLCARLHTESAGGRLLLPRLHELGGGTTYAPHYHPRSVLPAHTAGRCAVACFLRAPTLIFQLCISPTRPAPSIRGDQAGVALGDKEHLESSIRDYNRAKE